MSLFVIDPPVTYVRDRTLRLRPIPAKSLPTRSRPHMATYEINGVEVRRSAHGEKRTLSGHHLRTGFDTPTRFKTRTAEAVVLLGGIRAPSR
jgi:hypothetical protein